MPRLNAKPGDIVNYTYRDARGKEARGQREVVRVTDTQVFLRAESPEFRLEDRDGKTFVTGDGKRFFEIGSASVSGVRQRTPTQRSQIQLPTRAGETTQYKAYGKTLTVKRTESKSWAAKIDGEGRVRFADLADEARDDVLYFYQMGALPRGGEKPAEPTPAEVRPLDDVQRVERQDGLDLKLIAALEKLRVNKGGEGTAKKVEVFGHTFTIAFRENSKRGTGQPFVLALRFKNQEQVVQIPKEDVFSKTRSQWQRDKVWRLRDPAVMKYAASIAQAIDKTIKNFPPEGKPTRRPASPDEYLKDIHDRVVKQGLDFRDADRRYLKKWAADVDVKSTEPAVFYFDAIRNRVAIVPGAKIFDERAKALAQGQRDPYARRVRSATTTPAKPAEAGGQEPAKTSGLKLVSKDRYRATAAEKRLHGGSTVTEFFVSGDGVPSGTVVMGYGKTPGDRKTDARKRAEKLLTQGATTMTREEKHYSDPSSAQEFAMKLKRDGKTNIRIDKKQGKHVVSWNEPKIAKDTARLREKYNLDTPDPRTPSGALRKIPDNLNPGDPIEIRVCRYVPNTGGQKFESPRTEEDIVEKVGAKEVRLKGGRMFLGSDGFLRVADKNPDARGIFVTRIQRLRDKYNLPGTGPLPPERMIRNLKPNGVRVVLFNSAEDGALAAKVYGFDAIYNSGNAVVEATYMPKVGKLIVQVAKIDGADRIVRPETFKEALKRVQDPRKRTTTEDSVSKTLDVAKRDAFNAVGVASALARFIDPIAAFKKTHPSAFKEEREATAKVEREAKMAADKIAKDAGITEARARVTERKRKAAARRDAQRKSLGLSERCDRLEEVYSQSIDVDRINETYMPKAFERAQEADDRGAQEQLAFDVLYAGVALALRAQAEAEKSRMAKTKGGRMKDLRAAQRFANRAAKAVRGFDARTSIVKHPPYIVTHTSAGYFDPQKLPDDPDQAAKIARLHVNAMLQIAAREINGPAAKEIYDCARDDVTGLYRKRLATHAEHQRQVKAAKQSSLFATSPMPAARPKIKEVPFNPRYPMPKKMAIKLRDYDPDVSRYLLDPGTNIRSITSVLDTIESLGLAPREGEEFRRQDERARTDYMSRLRDELRLNQQEQTKQAPRTFDTIKEVSFAPKFDKPERMAEELGWGDAAKLVLKPNASVRSYTSSMDTLESLGLYAKDGTEFKRSDRPKRDRYMAILEDELRTNMRLKEQADESAAKLRAKYAAKDKVTDAANKAFAEGLRKGLKAKDGDPLKAREAKIRAEHSARRKARGSTPAGVEAQAFDTSRRRDVTQEKLNEIRDMRGLPPALKSALTRKVPASMGKFEKSVLAKLQGSGYRMRPGDLRDVGLFSRVAYYNGFVQRQKKPEQAAFLQLLKRGNLRIVETSPEDTFAAGQSDEALGQRSSGGYDPSRTYAIQLVRGLDEGTKAEGDPLKDMQRRATKALKAAAPFREYGPNYVRALNTKAKRVEDMMGRPELRTFLPELEKALEAHAAPAPMKKAERPKPSDLFQTGPAKERAERLFFAIEPAQVGDRLQITVNKKRGSDPSTGTYVVTKAYDAPPKSKFGSMELRGTQGRAKATTYTLILAPKAQLPGGVATLRSGSTNREVTEVVPAGTGSTACPTPAKTLKSATDTQITAELKRRGLDDTAENRTLCAQLMGRRGAKARAAKEKAVKQRAKATGKTTREIKRKDAQTLAQIRAELRRGFKI